MDGFYVGDIIGNSYAHENEEYNLKVKDFELFTNRSKFSDDTILSFATIEWILNSKHKSSEMIKILKRFYEKYPDKNPTIYGDAYVHWIKNTNNEYRDSAGNGGAMRSSVIGWYAKDLEELKILVKEAITPTHNNKNALIAAEVVAVAVFLFKNNHTKDEVLNYIEKEYLYDLHENINKYKKEYKYTSDAKETVRPALISLFNSDSYEDSIRNAVSFGGDTDTITTINSSIAEACYKEIPKEILQTATKYLPEEFIELLNIFKITCKKRTREGENMDFKIEENKIYLENTNGEIIAEIEFEKREDNKYVIYHTFVDESLRGQGIASKLVELAVNEIKSKGGIAEATCSYAKAWLEKYKS